MEGANLKKKSKRWVYKNQKMFFESRKLSDLVVKILSNRDIRSEEEAFEFLEPSYEKLIDPFAFTDMEKAVKLINETIEHKQKIVIYGDYDVDGISSTALLMIFLEKIGANVDYYIPSRQDEGYGLNKKALEAIKAKNTDLVITVDCGSTSLNEVEYANEIGLDMIITDHHELITEEGKQILPAATAVINPKRDKDKINTEYAGVGVAFNLVRALQKKYQQYLACGQEKWFLDLVALGTICDVVPVTGENRILISYGLKVLAKSKNIGIRSLATASSFALEDINSYHVGFLLGPRLNAAGRLKTAENAIKLLLTNDQSEANTLAASLSRVNTERQELTTRIVEEAKEEISKKDSDKKIYLVVRQGWPHGVVGIVASRLVEEFSKPVLVAEEMVDSYKGSARSIKNFDITEALSESKQFLSKFGGHKYAAGFEFPKENLQKLEKKLDEIAQSMITEDDLVGEIEIDAIIRMEECSLKLAEDLKSFEPLGIGNPKPVFEIIKARVIDLRFVGNPAIHLKMKIEKDGIEMNGMFFNAGGESQLALGDTIDLAINLDINCWNNRKNVEFRLIDYKHTDL